MGNIDKVSDNLRENFDCTQFITFNTNGCFEQESIFKCLER